MTDQGPQPTESTPADRSPNQNPDEAAQASDPATPEHDAVGVLRTELGPNDGAAEGPLGTAEPAVRQIQEQYRYSDEAREALLGSILRMVDEHRFGHRELSTEELRDLAEAWSALNDGLTGTEVGYNWTIRRLHARRSESRRHD